MPGLFEDREEQKYPKWIRYLGIIYCIVLLWTVFSLPPSGYDLESIILVIFLWLPVPFGAMYIIEKPVLLGEHKKAMRVLIAILAIIAIIWGMLLSYAFME